MAFSSRHYLMNDDGSVTECTLQEWAQSFNGNRMIAQEMKGDLYVSTVFLGLDHQFGDGPPLIFETMIFKTDENGHSTGEEVWMDRYSTKAEALLGHEIACEVAEQMQTPGLLEGPKDDE